MLRICLERYSLWIGERIIKAPGQMGLTFDCITWSVQSWWCFCPQPLTCLTRTTVVKSNAVVSTHTYMQAYIIIVSITYSTSQIMHFLQIKDKILHQKQGGPLALLWWPGMKPILSSRYACMSLLTEDGKCPWNNALTFLCENYLRILNSSL